MAGKDKKKYPWNKIKKKSPGPALAVYAGPEYFAKKNKPKDEPDDARFEEVYAGPDLPDDYAPPVQPVDNAFSGPPDTPQFMAVYAGPDFFSNNNTPAPGAFAPAVNGPDEPCLKTFCPQCGKEVHPPVKVCSECGFAFENICSCCGNAYPYSLKFCPECGTPNDKNE